MTEESRREDRGNAMIPPNFRLFLFERPTAGLFSWQIMCAALSSNGLERWMKPGLMARLLGILSSPFVSARTGYGE